MILADSLALSFSPVSRSRCQAGDPEALRSFYELIAPPVLGVATSMLGSRSEAEDVLHEVYLKAVGRLDQWNGEGDIRSWIYRMTVNECLSLKRRLKRWGKVADHLRREQVEASNPRAPNQILVQQFLHELSPRDRAVVVLKYVQGLSFEEVADVLSMPVGTAKSLARRAIQKGAKTFEES